MDYLEMARDAVQNFDPREQRYEYTTLSQAYALIAIAEQHKRIADALESDTRLDSVLALMEEEWRGKPRKLDERCNHCGRVLIDERD